MPTPAFEAGRPGCVRGESVTTNFRVGAQQKLRGLQNMQLRKSNFSFKAVTRIAAMLALAFVGIICAGGEADAASSRFCEGGRWVTSQQGDTLFVRGTHVQFDVDLRTGGVRDWALTGAANVGRLVERPTVIFSEKTPLHGPILTRT